MKLRSETFQVRESDICKYKGGELEENFACTEDATRLCLLGVKLLMFEFLGRETIFARISNVLIEPTSKLFYPGEL